MSPGAAAPPPAPAPVAARAPVHPPPPAAGGDESKTTYVTAAASVSGGVVGVLIAVDGPLQNEIFRVYDGENSMGRSQQARIVLDSRYISREHALLIHQDGTFGIKPLRDENPILVNEEKVAGGVMLSDGDRVQLGNTTLKFRTV
jgi:pSer/pThr/pTyr-binding forkhead associated (FHA) protein